jgi:hypothetical protein
MLDAHCPECGAPVEQSTRGAWLAFAPASFLRSLRTGALCIELGAGASVLSFVFLDAIRDGVTTLAGSSIAATVVGSSLSLALVALSTTGYWLFTAPEPGLVGRESGTSARRLLRGAAIASGAAALVQAANSLFFASTKLAATGPTMSLAWGSLLTLTKVIGIIAWAFVFFAAMQYTSWLATRIPDANLVKRSKLFLWLLPVLMVPLVCTCVGPLAAVILYIIHLDAFRAAASRCLILQQTDQLPMPLVPIMPDAPMTPGTSEKPPPSEG